MATARFRHHRLRHDRRVPHPGDQRDRRAPRSSPPSAGPRPTARRSPGMAGGECEVYDDLDAMLAHPGPRRRLRLHAQRRPPGAGRQGGAGGQARRRREAAGDHPARGATRSSTPATRPASGSARSSRRGSSPANLALKEAIDARPVRPPDPGRHLRQVVADPGVLRLGRLARDLGPRRRRRPDEPGDPQRRPALLADGRRRVDRGPDRDPGPRADRGRGHGRRRPPVQERGPRRDRGRHERLSRACSKRTEIHGDRGSARVEQDDITLWEFQEKVPSDDEILAAMAGQTGFKAGASDPRGITHVGHRDQLADFLQAIDEGRDPLVDGREGRKSVEIIRAIYRSAETGQAVKLPLSES